MTQDRRRAPRKPTAALASPTALDPTWLAGATSDELGAAFRQASTLPLDDFMNDGGHAVDLATRTIFNDEYWKGWLPRGLALRDIFTRLATGYAKRFWKQGKRYLGETLYLDGNILVKHALEEITIDRPTNDLDPGRYILLRYTDPVFEHLFYDVMRAADTGVIIYGGYTGKFPEGKRGFTGVLMRRYSFAQLGERDHQQLFRKGTRATRESLKGDWQMDVVTTSNHATRVGNQSFVESAGGKLAARFETISAPCRPGALVRRRALQRRRRDEARAGAAKRRCENDRGDVDGRHQPAVRALRVGVSRVVPPGRREGEPALHDALSPDARLARPLRRAARRVIPIR